MALCNLLEESLAAVADTRRCLLDALLAEPFASHDDARELEVVE